MSDEKSLGLEMFCVFIHSYLSQRMLLFTFISISGTRHGLLYIKKSMDKVTHFMLLLYWELGKVFQLQANFTYLMSRNYSSSIVWEELKICGVILNIHNSQTADTQRELFFKNLVNKVCIQMNVLL